jgi:hypothetical protein
MTAGTAPPEHADQNAVSGTVEAVSYYGASSMLALRAAGGPLMRALLAPGARVPAIGETGWLTWPVTAGTLLDH